MPDQLTQLKCEACRADAEQATDSQRAEWLPQIPLWEVVEQDSVERLQRVIVVANYAAALALVNRIAELSEQMDHHPALLLEWGKVTVQWWTHKIGGLHKNDFIAAARTDELAN